MKPTAKICDFRYKRGEDGTDYIEYEWLDLIRCADCIFYTHGRNGECRKLNARMDADDYCSKGRKKRED